jgi:hypothetical protein
MAYYGGIKPSSSGDGSNVTVSSTTQAYIIDYQCVTSHGNEAVSDATSNTAIGHNPGNAILTPAAYDVNKADTKKGMVHVPIHNPIQMTKAATLQNIIVKFDATSDATVESVALYYDATQVVKVISKKGATFHVDFSGAEITTYAYAVPTGVSVALDLRFPNSDSSITLYSVTLVYQAAA